MLVSTEWLASHLNDPNLVVLSVGPKAEYDKAHIPGAQYIDMPMISAKDSKLTLQMPPTDELERTFRTLGVSNDTRVILYSIAPTPQSTTRVYLTLDAMGLGRSVSLLDGGFGVWKSEGRQLTAEVRPVKAGTIQACPREDVVADLAFVAANTGHDGVHIVDARLNTYYTGEQIPPAQRAGHIPGAASVPFNSLVDESGKFRTADDLRSILAAAGIKPGEQVVSYCHVGQQATVVYFVARYLGFDARMFDGSWQEYSQHTELPASTGSKP